MKPSGIGGWLILPAIGLVLTPILLLVTERLSRTTGHVIPVDGGLQDGFLR